MRWIYLAVIIHSGRRGDDHIRALESRDRHHVLSRI
jgi:hypothetical protein